LLFWVGLWREKLIPQLMHRMEWFKPASAGNDFKGLRNLRNPFFLFPQSVGLSSQAPWSKEGIDQWDNGAISTTVVALRDFG
jgi:hypothetical protein